MLRSCSNYWQAYACSLVDRRCSLARTRSKVYWRIMRLHFQDCIVEIHHFGVSFEVVQMVHWCSHGDGCQPSLAVDMIGCTEPSWRFTCVLMTISFLTGIGQVPSNIPAPYDFIKLVADEKAYIVMSTRSLLQTSHWRSAQCVPDMSGAASFGNLSPRMVCLGSALCSST